MYHVVHNEKVICETAWSAAGPAAVYRLMRDGSTWPVWSPIGSFRLEREGEGGGESVGAIRVFKTGRATSVEELVELRPDRRLSYILLSGLPIRDYRSDIDLEPRDGGTAIQWRSTFHPKRPGTGWIYRYALGKFIQRCVDGLAAHAAGVAQADAAVPKG